MEYRIALLLRDKVADYYKGAIGENFLGCKVDYYSTSSLKELANIFSPIEKEYDGFIVSGSLSLGTIAQVCSDRETPMSYFKITVESIYKIILMQSILRKTFEPSKIGIDILDENDSLENIIIEDRLSDLLYEEDERVKQLSLEELENYEKGLVDKYHKFIKSNKINFFLTRTIAAIDLFNKYDIDYYNIYPSMNEIKNTFELLKKDIELKAMKDNLPAVIHFDLGLDKAEDGLEHKSIEFQKAMIDFNKKYCTNLILKSSFLDFEVYTDSQTVKNLTSDFTFCPLIDFLKKEVYYNGSIGYGIGRNVYHARINAINASKYAYTFKNNKYQSFIVNSDDRIINLDKKSIVDREPNLSLGISTEYVNEIANMTKLSSNTIVKLSSLMKLIGTNEVSSDELMSNLNMSLRTSNKILSTLNKCGIASIEGKKHIGVKGRPINIYRINMNY